MHQVFPLQATGQVRDFWIDYVRGIGIVLVVWGHMLDGLVRSGEFPDGPTSRWMMYSLYTFHMPLFFLLSGMNVQHSLRRGGLAFFVSKLWTVAYPYVLWSVLQGGILIAFAGATNGSLQISDLFAIWYRPFAQFWFLYALMFFHLTTMLLRSNVALIAVAATAFIGAETLPVRPDVTLMLHHFPFYVLGIFAAQAIRNLKPSIPATVLVWSGFAVVVAVSGRLSGFNTLSVVSLPATVLGIAGVLFVVKQLHSSRHLLLDALGRMSMTIFVMHIMAGSGVRIMLRALHVDLPPFIDLLVAITAGVGLPVLAHVILMRLRLLPVLGLAPWKRPTPAVPCP